MANDFVQTMVDARVDAASLSEFMFKPASAMVDRRLAPPINTMNYFLQYFNGIGSVYTQPAGYVTVDGVSRKTIGQMAIDATSTVNAAIEGVAIDANIINDALIKTVPVAVGAIARTQAAKNKETVTPYDFGLIGDGTRHNVSEWTVAGSTNYFPNLAAIQVAYPHVTSLSDTIDWAALQAFFDYCHSNYVQNPVVTCKAFVNKTIKYLGQTHATDVMYGDLTITTEDSLDALIWMTGERFKFYGRMKLSGKVAGNAESITTKCGLILGNLYRQTSYGNATNMYIGAVETMWVSDCAVLWGNNSHFSMIGSVRGQRIGASIVNHSTLSHATDFTVTGSIGGTTDQRSIISVSSLLPEKLSSSFRGITISGQLYDIRSVDRATSTLTLYPALPTTVTSGTGSYHYGTVLHTEGNDHANTRVHTIQAVQSGIVLSLQALYGTQVGTITTEFCGVGLLSGLTSGTNIGSTIDSVYFEGNTYDIVNAWNSTNCVLPINNTTALTPKKMVSLFAFRHLSSNSMAADSYYGATVGGDIGINGKNYNVFRNGITGDVTSPEKVQFINSARTIAVSGDYTLVPKFGKDSTLFVLGSSSGEAVGTYTFTAPTGATINGGSSYVVTGSDYNQNVIVLIRMTGETTFIASTVNNKGNVKPTYSIIRDLPSLAAGEQTSITLPATGVITSTHLSVAISSNSKGLQIWARCDIPDIITIYIRNETGDAVDLINSAFYVKVI